MGKEAEMKQEMRFCFDCQKRHRFMSSPWMECFGVPVEKSNLYHDGDIITRVIGHRDGFAWPVKVGQTLKQFVDEYQDYFNMGISIRSEV